MIICMPTVGTNGMTESVYNHFGSSRYFTIYDTESKSVQVVENDNEHHNHGSCQPLSVIEKYKIDAILTSGMGRRAVQMLNDGGIKVFLLSGDTVNDAVKKFEAGELQELTFENACGGHGCH